MSDSDSAHQKPSEKYSLVIYLNQYFSKIIIIMWIFTEKSALKFAHPNQLFGLNVSFSFPEIENIFIICLF